MNSDRIFLPVWRDDEVVIFASHQDKDGRLEWLSVAKSPLETNDHSFETMGRMPLSKETLAGFGALSERMKNEFSHYAPLPNINALDQMLASADNLLDLCGYFNFLRKYAVDGRQIKHYLATDPKARFSLEMALAVNRLIFDRYDANAARLVLESDFELAETAEGTAAERSEYFRSAARLYEMVGDFVRAATMMQKSVKYRSSDDKFRKLGDYYFQANDFERAIASFEAAKELAPLPLAASFRLGKILFESERFAEAQPYLELAAEAFPAPCQRMLEKIALETVQDHASENG